MIVRDFSGEKHASKKRDGYLTCLRNAASLLPADDEVDAAPKADPMLAILE